MSPLVSVIIPVFNCESYIGDTIRSVLNQEYENIEIIVVDDGSTDRTAQIVAEFGSSIKYFRQENQRVCKARNYGFEASTGAYLCFLDHDDFWYPWKIGAQIDCFLRNPEAGVVYTAFKVWLPTENVYPNPADLSIYPAERLSVDEDLSGWVYRRFLIDCWALTSTVMIRRDVFDRSGGFDLKLPYSEDWDLWLRLSRDCKFIMLSGVSTLYRQHPTQGSRVARDIDYRTALLRSARARWGLTDLDGQALKPAEFDKNIAKYHMQFAFDHWRQGSVSTARKSLLMAWRYHPSRIKYAALLLMLMSGFNPPKGTAADIG